MADPAEACRAPPWAAGQPHPPSLRAAAPGSAAAPPALRVVRHTGQLRVGFLQQLEHGLDILRERRLGFRLRQALENIRITGPAAIHNRLHTVTQELYEALRQCEGRVVSPRTDGAWSGILSFEVRGPDPRSVVRTAREGDVHVALRKGRVRISPHYYNTTSKIEHFRSALRDALRRSL